MIKVLAVMTAVNLWDSYTRPAIDTLFKQKLKGVKLDVLLVDNGSTDKTWEESLKLIIERGKDKDSDFLVTRYEKNIGVQEAWNNAIKKGFSEGYDYILIANNDVLFHRTAIQVLVNELEKKDEKVVLVSSLDLRCECERPENIFGRQDNEKIDVPCSPHPNFSSFMINRKMIKEVGYFDKGFFPAYFEDNDMHYRIQKAGLVALCCPASMFYHFASKTQTDFRYSGGFTSNTQFTASQRYFVDKWGGLPGKEKFDKPFNDKSKSIKYTKQNG